jgi:penicillin-binding protein 1A
MSTPRKGRAPAKGKSRTSKSRKKKKKPSLKRIVLKYSVLALFLVISLSFILFGTVYMGLFGALPDEDDLRNIQNQNASEIFTSDGKLIGKYYHENRSSIGYTEIPPHVIDALVATEDSRFFEHEGIDFYSIPRVVFKTIILGDRSSGGGSTISQQLIKNLYGRTRHGALSMPVNKLKENITALKLEDIYAKEEIITLYLNTVSFGEDVYGIKSASQRYFSKSPKDLTIDQAACLIGMLKATTTYNPRLHPEAAKERRNTVMALMVQQGNILPEEFEKLSETDLGINYFRESDRPGSAPYFRSHIEKELNQILEKINTDRGTSFNLYTDGLRIDVSIHSGLQLLAEKSMKEQMSRLQTQFDEHWKNQKPWSNDQFLWNEAERSIRYTRLKKAGRTDSEIKAIFQKPAKTYRYTPDGLQSVVMSPLDSIAYHQMILQASFLAMDSRTGQVLAYSGGIDFSFFPYDHIFARRQVGSTFKPFVYAKALERGYQPCDYIENKPIVFEDYDNWSPQNSGGPEGGYYTVKGGLAKSVNTVAAKLISDTGIEPVIELAERAGISSKIPAVPAIALGVADISLIEMVTAYTMFSQDGKVAEPWFIERVTDRDGNVLFEHKEKPGTRVLDVPIAQQVRSMMELVVDSGTAKSLRTVYRYPYDIAGKTGTTQNNADGWFIAASPNLVCGAWVGGQSPVVRFRSTRYGQGAATALPIVGSWFKSAVSKRETLLLLGKSFSGSPTEMQLDMLCPLYVESTSEMLLEMLFNKGSKELKKELKEELREEKKEEKEEKGGWMKRLIDKLKK